MSADDLKQKALDLVQSGKYFYMATVDGTTPRVRPMTCMHADNFTLYTCSRRDTEKIGQLQANPLVEACFMDSDTRQVRILAEVTVTEDEKDWSALPHNYERMPQFEDPDFLLMILKPKEVRFIDDWSSRYKSVEI